MGSANKTENLNLPQWQGNEYLEREDLNTAFATIDTKTAKLDSTGKVPSDQLPAMDYIPTSEKGAASGVATLDSSGKIPSTQLPDSVGEDIAALGKELHDWWIYASDTMAYTCVTPSDTSTKPYSYTETVKDSGSEVVATLVTTCNADGSYTETLTRGDVTVTRKWTKSGNTYERGAWANG